MSVENPVTTGKSVLFEDKAGDLFFVGDFEKGKRLAKDDRTAHETTRTTGDETIFLVELSDCDGPKTHSLLTECPMVAEWGVSMRSMEDAWRYAMAAQFGFVDEEYMGDEALLRLLDEAVSDE